MVSINIQQDSIGTLVRRGRPKNVPTLINEKGKLASSDMGKGLRYSVSSLLWSLLAVQLHMPLVSLNLRLSREGAKSLTV